MQTTYATHLELPSLPGQAEQSAAADVLTRWVRRRFAVDVTPEIDGSALLGGTSVNWNTLEDAESGVLSLWVDEPNKDGSAWRWRTYVDLGREGDCSWFRVRVGLYGAGASAVMRPDVSVGRPGLVRDLVQALPITVDERPLGQVMQVDANSAGRFVQLIEDQDRQLPIIAVSSNEENETFVDPLFAADRTLGLGHVAVLDNDASWFLTSELTKQLSCFGGAVRIYWPRFARTDDRFWHRLYLGGALEFLGPTGLVNEITEMLGRIAGLSIDEPPLRRKLILLRREQEIELRSQARTEVVGKAAESAGSDVSAEDFAAFAADYDDMQRQLTSIEQDALQVEHEIDRVRAERDDVRARLAALYRETNHPSVPLPEDLEPPSTVLRAVELARREAKHTQFLDSALTSAAASEYGDPSRVLDDLRLIEQVARDWATGELATGPSDAFRERSSNFRRGISGTAAGKYAQDYEIEWRGQTELMGPHLRRGVGAVSTILRIYMYFDTDHRQIVVGHVGRKLRDDGNKN